METVFQTGDRLYSCIYGWCLVEDINESKQEYRLRVESTGLPIVSSFENSVKHFSFKEYKLSGFTLEKPEELPEYGQIVWVKDEEEEDWSVTHFISYDDTEGETYPYKVSDVCSPDDPAGYTFCTKFNPYYKIQPPNKKKK